MSTTRLTPAEFARIRKRKLSCTWSELCAHVVPFENQFPPGEVALHRARSRKAQAAHMISWADRTRGTDTVVAVAHALTHDDWFDVAAAMCQRMVEVEHNGSREIEPTYTFGNRFALGYGVEVETTPMIRPFMHAVWINVAYHFWTARDRSSLRNLLEVGVLTSSVVLDMLVLAGKEEHELPVSTAYVALVAQSRCTWAASTAASVGHSDTRVFCCPVRCSIMRELIDSVHLISPALFETETDLTYEARQFWDILRSVMRYANIDYVRFLFRTLGRSFIDERVRVARDADDADFYGLIFGFDLLTESVDFLLPPRQPGLCHIADWPFSHVYGPEGVLATFARELRLEEFARLIFIELGFAFHMDRVNEDWIIRDGITDWLAYAVHRHLMEHMWAVVEARTDAEREAIVFDYDFSDWSQMVFIQQARWETHRQEILAQCNFTPTEAGGSVDAWYEEWKRTIRRLRVPRTLERLFDPRWAQEKLASRKRALESSELESRV